MTVAFERARRYLEMGRSRQALEVLAELDSSATDSPEAYMLRGYALIGLGRHDDAAEAARSGLAQTPEAVQLLHVLAMAEAGQGRLAEAEAAILAALEQEPEDVTLLCEYAETLMRGAQLWKADQLLRLAAEIDPEAAEWREGRVTLAYLRGDDHHAASLSRELLAEHPESIHGHRMLGLHELNEGRPGAATERFAEAVRSRPEEERFATEARAARARVRNPLWWPTTLLLRDGSWLVWFGGLFLCGGVAAMGAETLGVILFLLLIVVYLWALIAPAVLE